MGPALTAKLETRSVLEVSNLTVSVDSSSNRAIRILDDVCLQISEGESVGLVGESGSGKSLTSLAIMGLLPRGMSVVSGAISFRGQEITDWSAREMRGIRGSRMSMILQDPMSSLDPSFTIGNQMAEVLRLHRGLKGSNLERECIRLLSSLRIAHPDKVLSQYPHQLSGGMLQRVCSAIALSGDPDLLIADEPTTALDVTTQAQYLDLLHDLQTNTGFALILITHDLAVVEEVCQRLVVMYAGQVVEQGPLADVVPYPNHPYTAALLRAVPRLGAEELRPILGQVVDPKNYPDQACRFADRCRYAQSICRSASPMLSARENGRSARCFGTESEGWVEISYTEPKG